MNKIIMGVGYRESGDGEKRFCERYSETMGRCGCVSHYDIFAETEAPFSNQRTTNEDCEGFLLVYKGIQGFLLPPPHLRLLLHLISSFVPSFILISLPCSAFFFFFFFLVLPSHRTPFHFSSFAFQRYVLFLLLFCIAFL